MSSFKGSFQSALRESQPLRLCSLMTAARTGLGRGFEALLTIIREWCGESG